MFRCVTRRGNRHGLSSLGTRGPSKRLLASDTPSWSTPSPGPSLHLEPNPSQVNVDESVRNRLKAAGIGFPREAAAVRVKAPPGSGKIPISVQIAKGHVFHQWSLKFFDKDPHPWQQVLVKRLLQIKDQPLWWRCYAPSSDKAVVRRKAQQLLRSLFTEVLQERGYDLTGRKLLSGAEGQKSSRSSTGSRSFDGLYGTVFMSTHQALQLVNTPRPELRAYMERVLEKLELELRTSSDKPIVMRENVPMRPKPARPAPGPGGGAKGKGAAAKPRRQEPGLPR